MPEPYAPDWVEVSTMLREALERYRNQRYYASLSTVVDELIAYIERHSGKWLSEKTLRRDMGNASGQKKVHPIADWRIRIYVKWLSEEAGKDYAWLARWLDHTAYPVPAKLLAELNVINAEHPSAEQIVKTNAPALKNRLWGRFLGRQPELDTLRQWADQQRHPIAALYGFGGTGKTTLQQKVAEEFVDGPQCRLRWPYQGAVWVSAVDYARGKPCLTEILRKIALVLDGYPGYTHEEFGLIPAQAFRNDIAALLEHQRILVLLDNFETIERTSQIEILQFFHGLRGTSQLLISTRYRPDWLSGQESDDLYSMAYVLIRVEGLSSADAASLVQDFLAAKAISPDAFRDEDLTRLLTMTQNNPKAMLAVLGLVEQGLPLSSLLTSLASGTPSADNMYTAIIDCAWQEMLSPSDQAVLMAKALFSHSVHDRVLGQVAGVDELQLHAAITKLTAIAFFEVDHSSVQTARIRTHPLAQEFARRILHNDPEFKREMEQRWWRVYGPAVARRAGQTPYDAVPRDLEEDVENVLEQIERHVTERTVYALQAAQLFGGDKGLGGFLVYWGQYEDILRIAPLALSIGIAERHVEILGECGLGVLARVYRNFSMFDEAEHYTGLVFEQNTTLNNPWLAAWIEMSRGYTYWKRLYLGSAKQIFHTALQGFLKIDAPFHTAIAYTSSGRVMLDMTEQDLPEGRDAAGDHQDVLAEIERYLDQSDRFLARYHERNAPDLDSLNLEIYNRISQGTIARIRGQFERARTLFLQCLGHCPSLFKLTRVYFELALLEHLAEDKTASRSYEEKASALFQQLTVLKPLPVWHCFNVIERLKQAGQW